VGLLVSSQAKGYPRAFSILLSKHPEPLRPGALDGYPVRTEFSLQKISEFGHIPPPPLPTRDDRRLAVTPRAFIY